MTAASDDRDLLQRWRTGDRASGSALFKRHRNLLARFFRLQTHEQDGPDLEQQVWLAVFASRVQEFEASFRAYLLGIARHILHAHIRRSKPTAGSQSVSSAIVALDTPLSQAVAKRLDAQRLLAALQLLPAATRLLLELRYFEEMSTSELAASYGVAVGTVKSRMFSAREQLAEAMRSIAASPR